MLHAYRTSLLPLRSRHKPSTSSPGYFVRPMLQSSLFSTTFPHCCSPQGRYEVDKEVNVQCRASRYSELQNDKCGFIDSPGRASSNTSVVMLRVRRTCPYVALRAQPLYSATSGLLFVLETFPR